MALDLDIGIDLGTASCIIAVKDKGIVSREPTVVAIEKSSGRLMKVGMGAQRMMGRTPGNIAAIRPVQNGVICDYELTKRMLREMVRKVSSFTILKPRILFSVPSGITEVEERAVIEAGMEAGARRVYLMEASVAAALGAGADVTKPEGHFVVDIGAGTTDIAVISSSGVAQAESIKAAGDAFNEAIIRFVRQKHSILLGRATAEEIKKGVGSVYPGRDSSAMEGKGRCLITGVPKLVSVSTEDIIEALQAPCGEILEAIHRVLEETDPELVGDIAENGITITGGGALINGIDKLIENSTSIPTRVADDAELCVAYGLNRALGWLNDMPDGTINLYRRRQLMQYL